MSCTPLLFRGLLVALLLFNTRRKTVMRKFFRTSVYLALMFGCVCPAAAQIDILGKVNDEVNRKTDEAIDDALHPKPKEEQKKEGQKNTDQTTTTTPGNTVNTAQTIKAYQNYDFKPGENIIFEDNFSADQDGEFPAHWNLESGQAVVNKVNGEPTFLITDGNYAIVTPRIKTESYLTDPFTIELDFYQASGNMYAPMVRFVDDGGTDRDLHFGQTVSTAYFPHELNGNQIGDESQYFGKWHHGAIIYKNDQMKVYVDNTRALVVPHCDFKPIRVQFAGIGDANDPITFRNVRIAAGGDQKMIGNILTDGKFVTHGITFDVGKATIKPESMGVLNEIAKFLKDNSAVRMEVDGHTDSDGDPAKNQKLSEDRAASVKTQLVSMGVDAPRLSTKGFGASKPLGSNDSPEGKANNRRVEFVKLK